MAGAESVKERLAQSTAEAVGNQYHKCRPDDEKQRLSPAASACYAEQQQHQHGHPRDGARDVCEDDIKESAFAAVE